MQVELLYRQIWTMRLELANAIFEYLEIFHNRRRRHGRLGRAHPTEYEMLGPTAHPGMTSTNPTPSGGR